MAFSLEHIDPQNHHLVCGLCNEFNEVLADLSYNKRKNNRFVPYRVNEHSAPVMFGDTGEFLIEDEWVICEFGGEVWWKESNRLGNSQINCAQLPASKKCKQKARENMRKIGVKAGPINVKKATAAATIKNRNAVILSRSDEYYHFESQSEAVQAFNLSHGCLSMVLSGSLTHHKGFTARKV